MAKAKKAKNQPRSGQAVNTLLDDDDDPKKSSAEEAADEEDEKPASVKKAAVPKKAAKTATVPDEDADLYEDDAPAKPPKGESGKKRVVTPPPRMVVDLDGDRKLTKKDEARLAGWKGKQRGKMLDGFFARQRDEARKKFGHSSVYMGSEAETLVIGIPCPALAFEYVIAQDCFPLGLVMQIVAKHGVGKSGLLAEFGRWFDLARGGMVLCENETKFNPHWYSSIMGREVYERMQLHRCTSVENWQEHLTWSTKKMREDMQGTKEVPGPGKTFPVLFGVDSIMGKMSRENQEKILGKTGKKGKLGTTGEGFAQARSFPIEAGSITKYMRTYPQLIDEWPFSLVLINHLRIKQDDMGNQERNKTGGEQVNFQESFELELKKIGGHAKKIATADFEGITLQLSCEKNSFGPTGRKIQVRLLWWHEHDEESNAPLQKSVWDWDWATIHLLNTLVRGENASTYLRAKLKAMDFHLDCPNVGDSDNTAWSKSLGMTAKDALPWAEVGALIREDKALTTELRNALGITRRPVLAGDYMKQLETLAEEMP